jgi:N-methylhydantoinase A/oxoprolinase/acetone carboxylase beta subunit
MDDFLLIGVDIGGTFTDAVALSAKGLRLTKVPSQPADPGQAVLAAIKALDIDTIPSRFLHSTTLVTNLLLERKGAATGFITSHGFRDVLHIGRHKRPLNYAIKQEIAQQQHPPVPRKWRLTVAERLTAGGEVVTPLDETAVQQAARQLLQAGVQAIAIGFLHAYRSPVHEQRARQLVEQLAPDLFVCTSSQVSPRFREYERFLTTAWNARVAPAAARYLKRLVAHLSGQWPGLPLTMMTSNGGLEEVGPAGQPQPADLKQTPIRLALSGPAAAGNAIVRVAQDLELANCVGLDVGGTSSDIVVVRDGRLRQAPLEERQVGGYPLQIPMLDLHTVGSGGGSLVYRDGYGTLHVGPESAGANPGPACYAQGGTHPTVTDAALIAGRLPAEVRLGGHLPLQPDLAKKAFQDTFALTGATALAAISLDVLTLAENQIAFAIRERTVARGLDPHHLALVAAGGAGPMLACGVADALELAEVVVPPHPGLLAAWGLLAAPDRREGVVTILRRLSDISASALAGYRQQAVANLAPAAPPEAEVSHICALRYLGQGFEVEVRLRPDDTPQMLAGRFHLAHEQEYGFSLPEAAVEWVELRAAWEIPPRAWRFPPSQASLAPVERVPVWERAEPGGPALAGQAQLWARPALRPGVTVPGPAIILEEDTTIYTPTGWQARLAEAGYLRLTRVDVDPAGS